MKKKKAIIVTQVKMEGNQTAIDRTEEQKPSLIKVTPLFVVACVGIVMLLFVVGFIEYVLLTPF